MATGHIKLGQVGGPYYAFMLNGGPERGRTRYLSNPQSSKIGQGVRRLEDDQDWDYWHMTDWQAGLGQVEPDAQGYLYGYADTRVPQNIILPQAWRRLMAIKRTNTSGSDTYDLTDLSWDPEDDTDYTSIAVGGTGNPEKICFSLYANLDSFEPIEAIAIPMIIPGGAEVNVGFFNSSGGNPTTVTTYYGSISPSAASANYVWLRVELDSAYDPSAGIDTYYIGIWPTSTSDEISVACSVAIPYWYDDAPTPTTTHEKTWTYEDSAWSEVSSGWFPFFLMTGEYDAASFGGTASEKKLLGAFVEKHPTEDYDFVVSVNSYESVPSTTWMAQSFYVYDEGIIDVDSEGAATEWDDTPLGGAAVWGTTAYFPYNDTTHYTSGISGSSLTDSTAFGAHGFYAGKQYLWRWVDNKLYYSSDAATWSPSGGISVCPSSESILGVAEMGGDIYASCSNGLAWIAPGDFSQGLFSWRDTTEESGTLLTEHGGALYFRMGDGIYSYSSTGQVMRTWVTRDDDLPYERLGEVVSLTSTGNWLLALVKPADTIYPYVLLAYSGSSWSVLAELPRVREDLSVILYSARDRQIIVTGGSKDAFRINFTDSTVNPANDSTSKFLYSGYIETPWFDGAIKMNDKDYESVGLITENLDSNTTVTVLWQDDASTDWETLAVFTSNNDEQRWSNYSTRPTGTKRFRLAIRLWTSDQSITPVVNAIVTKFLTNVTDKSAWELAIVTNPETELLDGTLMKNQAAAVDTHAEIVAFLDTLQAQSYPFIFQDIDGTKYEVRERGNGQEEIVDYAYELGTVRFNTVRHMTLQQITEGAYT